MDNDYMKLRDEIEALSRFLTKARFTAEPQDGGPGHCGMAQVFSNNVALCGLEPSYDPAYATGAAQLIALLLDKRKIILSALAQAADAGRWKEGLDVIKDAVRQHEDGEFYPGDPASVLAFISGTAIGHLETALQGEA